MDHSDFRVQRPDRLHSGICYIKTGHVRALHEFHYEITSYLIPGVISSTNKPVLGPERGNSSYICNEISVVNLTVRGGELHQRCGFEGHMKQLFS